jgi:hypothetical protein
MQTNNTGVLERPNPRQIVEHLLDQPMVMNPALSPIVARRVQTLDRQATAMVADARKIGHDIDYLGINPLFNAPRVYEGPVTDWVMSPIDSADEAKVPARERQILRDLKVGDIHIPLMFIAHEVEKERTKELELATNSGSVVVSRGQAKALVGPTPAPAEALTLSDQLARRSTQVVQGAKRGALVAGGLAAAAVAAPIALTAAAASSLATMDPIIIGAVPALRSEVGQPAAWLVLARWDW